MRHVAIAFVCCLLFGDCFAWSQAQSRIFAQQLVEDEMVKHPDLVAIALHVTPPGTRQNTVVASTLESSIGKPSDDDDVRIAGEGGFFAEATPAKQRYEILLGLNDKAGHRVGALGVIFHWTPGSPITEFRPEAERVREALQPQILSLQALFNQVPLVEVAPDVNQKPTTFVQRLVDRAIAEYPQIIILVIRAEAPGTATYVVVGSNIGRYGSPAGKDDMRVISTGTTSLEEDLVKHRFEVEPALRDSDGRILGSLSVVFSYRQGDDKSTLIRIAETVQSEMAAQLPDKGKLFERDTR
jgi:hypothetical protein